MLKKEKYLAEVQRKSKKSLIWNSNMRKTNISSVVIKPLCLRFNSSLCLACHYVPMSLSSTGKPEVKASAPLWKPASPPFVHHPSRPRTGFQHGLWTCAYWSRVFHPPLPSPPSHSPRNTQGLCYSCLHPQGSEPWWLLRLSGVKVTSRSHVPFLSFLILFLFCEQRERFMDTRECLPASARFSKHSAPSILPPKQGFAGR